MAGVRIQRISRPQDHTVACDLALITPGLASKRQQRSFALTAGRFVSAGAFVTAIIPFQDWRHSALLISQCDAAIQTADTSDAGELCEIIEVLCDSDDLAFTRFKSIVSNGLCHVAIERSLEPDSLTFISRAVVELSSGLVEHEVVGHAFLVRTPEVLLDEVKSLVSEELQRDLPSRVPRIQCFVSEPVEERLICQILCMQVGEPKERGPGAGEAAGTL